MNIFPVPESTRQRKLIPGPWIPGEVKPIRDGKYLREFDDDDRVFSWWRNGRWYTQDFFNTESDVSDVPWRGSVPKPSAKKSSGKRRRV